LLESRRLARRKGRSNGYRGSKGVFVREETSQAIEQKIAGFDRVALQFSGGKDSLACLHLLKPWWHRLIVIWANPGDPFPETVELVNEVSQNVAEFYTVSGNCLDSPSLPVDLLPIRSSMLGMQLEPDGNQIALRSRYDCCWENFWLPMTQAVKRLNVDLLIRGQRNDEELRVPIPARAKDPSGAEIFLPIQHWTARDVKSYLADEGVSLPRFYETMDCSVDCMRCTAYLKDTRGKVEYLRKYHPHVAMDYESRLARVASALVPDIDELKASLLEINHGV
jgi:phosphoadenosine phosphosulfate reductase